MFLPSRLLNYYVVSCVRNGFIICTVIIINEQLQSFIGVSCLFFGVAMEN